MASSSQRSRSIAGQTAAGLSRLRERAEEGRERGGFHPAKPAARLTGRGRNPRAASASSWHRACFDAAMEDVTLANTPIQPSPASPPRHGGHTSAWAGAEFSFRDLLDTINPL